jgi:hypothetical protein
MAYKFAEVRRSRIDWECWYARSDDPQQDAILRDHCGRLGRVKNRVLEALNVFPDEVRWVKVGDSLHEAWTKPVEVTE